MIDPENQIFNECYTALLSETDLDPDVTSEYVRSPSKLPHASIVMLDNYPLRYYQDNSLSENMNVVVFDVNAYSNKTTGKKSECKRMIAIIDDVMYSHNFIRTSQTPVPNLEDATIYRIHARYEGVTDGKYFYRR